MLVLSRKRGERIRIGDSVEVTVLAISSSRVKLGFTGPPDVWIHRDEVYQQNRELHADQRVPVGTGVD